MNTRHTLPRAPSAARHRMHHPWLTAEASVRLKAEAERRRLHPDVLAARLLELIAADDLYDAVLG